MMDENRMQFGFGTTALAEVIVATSPRGVAAILLGDGPAALRRALAVAFPGATLVHDDAAVALDVAAVVALIAAPHLPFDRPLDPRGSALEIAVWEALRGIPAGETRSYGALARSLGVPATAQEVGAACAANRIAVAIPCHRVVKADGAISGYRWGVARKRHLLNREAVATHTLLTHVAA